MKRLILNITLFLVPVIIGIVILPVNPKLKFAGLKNDCFNHGIWIHDRIYENSKPVDIAFIGTSQTINGINDQLISEQLNSINAVNFGYCRLGRNLHYALLKELLQTKKPKMLILEVREKESKYSHPVFPNIASSKNVYLQYPFFNREVLMDIWQHSSYKLELLQDWFFANDTTIEIDLNPYGFATSPDTASIQLLEEIKQRRKGEHQAEASLMHNFHYNFSKEYLKRIYKTCEENNIKLQFLYLRGFGSSYLQPTEIETYNELGHVLFPPLSILEDRNNWYDENHLNNAGAAKLSEWLVEELRSSI